MCRVVATHEFTECLVLGIRCVCNGHVLPTYASSFFYGLVDALNAHGVKEAKLAKEKRDAHYPTPEEPQRCIVCRDMTATISCMECPNKACQACIRHECLDKGEPFLYFHHHHCLRLAHRTCLRLIFNGIRGGSSSGRRSES